MIVQKNRTYGVWIWDIVFSSHTKHLCELSWPSALFLLLRSGYWNIVGRLYSYLAGLMGKKSLCMQIASLWRGLCCISVLCHILTDLLWLCEVKVNEAGRSFWLNKCLLTQYFLIICLYMQREIILKPCFCQFYDIEQVLFAGLLKLFTCCYCL